ncbi:MAG: ATP/GTP-binding protein [Thermoplasmatales archaeon]|nr:ATP/GTP-binding protein [Thermoplasmatales archaeon]
MTSEEPTTIYFTGTAGAGKTSAVRAYSEWLKSAGHDATVVNLDPGNESDELAPDVDVREWVRLGDLMEEYGLGPNGAQVAAADMIALKVFEIKQALSEFHNDYVLVDTPGQVELFAFRESSKAIVDALSGDRSMITFLFDPALAREPSGFISLLLLSSTVEFRFRLPMSHLLSKTDTLRPEQLQEILGWSEEPDRLYERIRDELATPDVTLTTELFRAIESTGPFLGLIPVSSAEGTGFEAFYRAAQRTFAGDEDLEPSQGPTDL